MIQLRFFCSEIEDPSENQKGHVAYWAVSESDIKKKKRKRKN